MGILFIKQYPLTSLGFTGIVLGLGFLWHSKKEELRSNAKYTRPVDHEEHIKNS